MSKLLKAVGIVTVTGVIVGLANKVREQQELIDELYETTDNYSKALDRISCIANDE